MCVVGRHVGMYLLALCCMYVCTYVCMLSDVYVVCHGMYVCCMYIVCMYVCLFVCVLFVCL